MFPESCVCERVCGYNGVRLYLLLLSLHEWASLAAGVRSRINTMREILKWLTFCYRQQWIKSLVCIQEERDGGLTINSASYKNPKQAANMVHLYIHQAGNHIRTLFWLNLTSSALTAEKSRHGSLFQTPIINVFICRAYWFKNTENSDMNLLLQVQLWPQSSSQTWTDEESESGWNSKLNFCLNIESYIYEKVWFLLV